MGALAWFLGFNFLLCGANGICLVLYATHDRHLRPWEQIYSDGWSTQNTSSSLSSSDDSDEATLAWSDQIALSSSDSPSSPPPSHHHNNHHNSQHNHRSNTNTSGGGGGNGGKKRHVALEAFGTANSYGHEIWVEKYQAKMMVRKIFDKSIWVENESIRIMQDKVALQALIWSIIITVPLSVLFTAVPAGKYF